MTIKTPLKPDGSVTDKNKPKGLRLLQTHIEHLKQLTELVRPYLPADQDWQVVGLQRQTLSLATTHHTAASQLRYLQTLYLKQLKTEPVFAQLTRLRVVVVQPVSRVQIQHRPLPPLSKAARETLIESASLFNDGELSETLLRMASKK